MARPYFFIGGWYRKPLDFKAELAKYRPDGLNDPEQLKFIRRIVGRANGAVRAANEIQMEQYYRALSEWIRTGNYPGGKREWARITRQAQAAYDNHVAKYHEAHPSFFSHLNPAKLISAAANVVSSALPFVKTALSLVPGIGTGINAALSAAEAIAKGRPLTDAFVDALKSAVPGGPIAQTAFNTAVGLAKGQRIDEAALNAAKEQLPPVAQKAFDAGLAIAHGRNLQDLAIDQVKSLAADQLKGLKLPIPEGINVPIHEQGGFKIALGVLGNTKLPGNIPLTPAAALAIRARLTPAAQLGFDRAMGLRALRHYQAGSKHVPSPRPRPPMRGATFVTQDGRATVL